MSRAAAPIFPLRDAWLPALPVLPLVLFAAVLSLLLDPARQLDFLAVDPGHFVARPQREYIHLGDVLTYVSLAAFHTLLCVAVIATIVVWARRLPARRFQGAGIFFAGVVVLIVAVGMFFAEASNRQVLVQLGYKATCQLVEAADLATGLASGCWTDRISNFTWLAWIPTFSGMAAVAFTAAFAYAATSDPPSAPNARDRNSAAWRGSLENRIRTLQRSVYLLSAVLVSSTVTITVFAHLPVGLLGSKDGDIALAVSKYATGLSTFWGALFSVTLIATFAAPVLRVLKEAYADDGAARESAEFRQWLHDHVFQSVKRQLGTVLSILAPLLVGPLSKLLSSFSGF